MKKEKIKTIKIPEWACDYIENILLAGVQYLDQVGCGDRKKWTVEERKAVKLVQSGKMFK